MVYYRSFMTFQIASHVCNFFKIREYFIELGKNRQRQSTYRLSKAKYNYQNKLTKVNKNTSNYRPRHFPKQTTIGKQKATQQHFNQSLVQNCGNIREDNFCPTRRYLARPDSNGPSFTQFDMNRVGYGF